MQMKTHIFGCTSLTHDRRDDILAIVESLWQFMRPSQVVPPCIAHPFSGLLSCMRAQLECILSYSHEDPQSS
ncbi:hypothetical protein GOP47_0016445 [Adiantum capillus-veneris]|uniref:Uncharacterized protein n=1 Tax=Adiantum capillus-veneris TaxID=13818 RepID=A0A9D4UHU7_ADICA|nr:hypothetical protein GOP47_0016445 [Adiantum capillus-veneris]